MSTSVPLARGGDKKSAPLGPIFLSPPQPGPVACRRWCSRPGRSFCKVDGGLDHEHDPEREQARGKKRRVEQGSLGSGSVEQSVADRHRAWLDRAQPGRDPRTWRPRTIHRQEAKQWCCALGNQARIAADKEGLVVFQPNDSELWAKENWRSSAGVRSGTARQRKISRLRKAVQAQHRSVQRCAARAEQGHRLGAQGRPTLELHLVLAHLDESATWSDEERRAKAPAPVHHGPCVQDP